MNEKLNLKVWQLRHISLVVHAVAVSQVACVHVYSGRMDRGAAVGIGSYYALMAWMILHQQVNYSA
jgi:hypothetical protein